MPDSASYPSVRQASTTEQILSFGDRQIRYTAIAAWQTLFEKEKPVAEMFHVAYLAEAEYAKQRPLTFVFNGGPGAASAYLHMGALGPKRVSFAEQGRLPKPPVQVVDNAESWLSFTDLVFIDPIGTGFSRSLPSDPNANPPSDKAMKEQDSASPKETDFWEVERDLKALGEFIQRFLSEQNRWLSPIFIAGESYGGFRVAKLARKLQQDFGVGLSGAILISPALEFSLLEPTDYNLLSWATLLPSMAAAAAHHGLAQWASEPGNLQAHLSVAEQFARKTLIPLLAMGDAVPSTERQETYQQLAQLIGLPVELIERKAGRVDMEVFARELLKAQQKIVGLYDASVVAIDPFPDRASFQGADPTLDGLDRLFTGAINSHLRDTLKVKTELTYNLLNFETFRAWKFQLKNELKQGFVGSVDDLRVGMTMNPFMKVYVTHGWFDLVTPYFASSYLADLMKLNPEIRPNLTLKNFQGGHMFYTWDDSRMQWFTEMNQFYQAAIA